MVERVEVDKRQCGRIVERVVATERQLCGHRHRRRRVVEQVGRGRDANGGQHELMAPATAAATSGVRGGLVAAEVVAARELAAA